MSPCRVFGRSAAVFGRSAAVFGRSAAVFGASAAVFGRSASYKAVSVQTFNGGIIVRYAAYCEDTIL